MLEGASLALVAQLNFGAGLSAAAQEADRSQEPVTARPGESAPDAGITVDDASRIVVIGNRAIVAALADVEVEQTYDSDRIRAYAVNSVQELLDIVANENGEPAPSVLVNGRPVSDIGDIADLPAEAVRRVEVLPQGTAARIGGAVGQRALNVVLVQSLTSLTVTASRQLTTEPGWSNTRGEATATLIRGQDRLNLTARNWRNTALLESERGLLGGNDFGSYSPIGNILPSSGTEVDAMLSQLLGQKATSVALSEGMTNPSLQALLAGANRINPSQAQSYRTLRGAGENTEVSLAGAKKVNDWLTATFNGRLGWNDTSGLNGLPSGRFLVSAGNAFSPFSGPVLLAQSDPTRPLENRSHVESRSASLTLNANFGAWRSTLLARYDRRAYESTFDRLDPASSGLVLLAPSDNPFAGNLAARLGILQASSSGHNLTKEVNEELEGPLFSLPAGSVRLLLTASAVWTSFGATYSTTGDVRAASRVEALQRGRLTIPLTSATGPGNIGIGAMEVTGEIGWLRVGGGPDLRQHAVSFNWWLDPDIRLTASTSRQGRAVALELVSAPSTTFDNVRYFDPLTGEEAFVTTISGGSSGLKSEMTRTDKLSLWTRLVPRLGLQLTTDYVVTRVSNRSGSLPPPSAAVVAAFPDRFVRDGSGRLVLVDNRTVNFDSQRNRELRFALVMAAPLGARPGPRPAAAIGSPPRSPVRSGPPLMLTANLNYNLMLSSRTTIRAGLPEVNLLDGGAIGLAGGLARHNVNASAALSQGGTGMRLTGTLQGPSALKSGTLAAPEQYTFGSLFKLGASIFIDLRDAAPRSRLARDTRVTLSYDNIFNARQSVGSLSGNIPTYFQPRYRDPLGRTVSLELRKVF